MVSHGGGLREVSHHLCEFSKDEVLLEMDIFLWLLEINYPQKWR